MDEEDGDIVIEHLKLILLKLLQGASAALLVGIFAEMFIASIP